MNENDDYFSRYKVYNKKNFKKIIIFNNRLKRNEQKV